MGKYIKRTQAVLGIIFYTRRGGGLYNVFFWLLLILIRKHKYRARFGENLYSCVLFASGAWMHHVLSMAF